MIEFQKLRLSDREWIEPILQNAGERGCEFSFSNLFCWGRQRAALCHNHLVMFSQFNRRTVYPYPIGTGDKKPVLDAIIADARERGIPCRITGMVGKEAEELERMYPGRFRIHWDRDGFNYVYNICDLADLKGRKYQRKRNHIHKFSAGFPGWQVEPVSRENLPAVQQMVEHWYAQRQEQDPAGDYHMERSAITKALQHFEALGMEGLVLLHDGKILAMTLGSFLSKEIFDVNYEKALAHADGAYTAINNSFARYLRDKYPGLRYLNREEDMGLEGLRKAKLSYCPDHMVEKCWGCLLEDGYEY